MFTYYCLQSESCLGLNDTAVKASTVARQLGHYTPSMCCRPIVACSCRSIIIKHPVQAVSLAS